MNDVTNQLRGIRKSFKRDIIVSLFVTNTNATIINAKVPNKDELLEDVDDSSPDHEVDYFG